MRVGVIRVSNLQKSFTVRRNLPGVWGALKGLFRAKREVVEAIGGISFDVGAGERLAFIGPNGAGKSTTIKMLTGILFPTCGEIEVLGKVPWKDRKRLGYEIGTVFGQRTQLWYHLPPRDTFELLAKIYELEEGAYLKQLGFLCEAFELGDLMDRPVRKLSLGQRMRCEIVASLLHSPKILFLDEPTIGLDANAKLKIRGILNQMAQELGTTLFLTSHDTADIEQICERVIVLDEGKILRDGSLSELKREFAWKKRVRLTMEEKAIGLEMEGLEVLDQGDYRLDCELDLRVSPIEGLIHEALKKTSLVDVTIEDPSMDEIIRNLYAAK